MSNANKSEFGISIKDEIPLPKGTANTPDNHSKLGKVSQATKTPVKSIQIEPVDETKV